MTTRFLVAAALILAGCSAPAEDPEIGSTLTGYVFSPEAGLDDAVADAGSSLRGASGVDLMAGDGGVVVRFRDEQDPPSAACADTAITYYQDTLDTTGIEIIVNSPLPAGCVWPLWRIVEHEMIHAIRAWDRATPDPNQGHSVDGVFSGIQRAKLSAGGNLLDRAVRRGTLHSLRSGVEMTRKTIRQYKQHRADVGLPPLPRTHENICDHDSSLGGRYPAIRDGEHRAASGEAQGRDRVRERSVNGGLLRGRDRDLGHRRGRGLGAEQLPGLRDRNPGFPRYADGRPVNSAEGEFPMLEKYAAHDDDPTWRDVILPEIKMQYTEPGPAPLRESPSYVYQGDSETGETVYLVGPAGELNPSDELCAAVQAVLVKMVAGFAMYDHVSASALEDIETDLEHALERYRARS